jgi:hypothetical protein
MQSLLIHVFRNYIYLLKQILLFYVHVNVKNVYLSLNMLNMSFSKQFYIFARILLGQSWPYSCTTEIICIFAFEYHLQYELSKSPLFVILPNLREKMQSLLIHVFTVELCQRCTIFIYSNKLCYFMYM